MSAQTWWYIARSGGIVALGLAGASVLWGLFMTTRLLNGSPSPKWLLDLHRFLGGAAVIFTAIHVAALMFDSYVGFSWIEVTVPMAAGWKPGAVAWGVVGMWLLLAVELTSLVMKKIPRKAWRLIHFASYLMVWTGVVHGALAGTDARNRVYITGVSLMTLGIFYLTIYRILAVKRRGSKAKTKTGAKPRAKTGASPQRRSEPVPMPATQNPTS